MAPRVPYTVWVRAFAETARVLADLARRVEREHPELFANIPGRANVLRLGLAKVVLRELHRELVTKPDMTVDELKKTVYEIVARTPVEKLAEAISEVCGGECDAYAMAEAVKKLVAAEYVHAAPTPA